MRARRMGEEASTALPARSAKPGDYRPEATARRVDRGSNIRADDRADLRRLTDDEARRFARENPTAGYEDYSRWRRSPYAAALRATGKR